MKILKVIFIIISITFFAIGCGSSGGPITTTVSGTILDGTGAPVAGAEVIIRSSPVTVMTDANGFFSATVEIGTHTIEVRKDSKIIYAAQINCKENTPLSLGNISSGHNPGSGGNKRASGTYIFDAQTQILTVNIENTNYTECGPDHIGTETLNVTSLTPTILSWEDTDGDGDANWWRSAGSSGNLVGKWFNSDDDNSLELTFKSDGTWMLTGIGCNSGSSGNPYIVGTWKMTDIQGTDVPSQLPLNSVVFTDSTYAVTVEGDCSVSGIYTSDLSSIWLTSTSRTGNTDSFCDYHDTPHRLGYTVTSSTLIITEGDVVITLTKQQEGNPGVNTASGTYSYDNQTGVLTTTFVSSTFDECGPSVGTSTSSVVSISSDMMVINSPVGTQNWSRTGGTSGDMTGTWHLLDDDVNVSLVIEADGTLTVSGNISCDGSRSG